MCVVLLACLVGVVAAADCDRHCMYDPASEQMAIFRNETQGPLILTSSNGAPVEYKDTLVLNSDLATNDFFNDLLHHAMEERIPERAVHAKGAGAFGYFEVTHNVSCYCKAELFSKIGKRTPVAVRFSHSSMDKGEPDIIPDSRGFAVKFYSNHGNFDLAMFNTPMFMFREPMLFQPIGKIIRRNPCTNLRDPNMMWDLVTRRLELLNFFLFIFGKHAIPKGFRHLPGFPIHTYQIYNKCGQSYFCRFHFIPDLGVEHLFTEDAIRIGTLDPDYAVRDLYNAIACGDWPTWTVGWQLLTEEDVENAKLDVFDITKLLPEKDYPVTPIGKLVLNRNPRNFFADVEQMAFCPGNLVPGILGSPDKAFAARRLAYKATQRHRLGANFNKIRVNCPLRSNPHVYERDGVGPVGMNGGAGPSYYPNTYNGPVPYVDKHRPALIKITQRDDDHENFAQVKELYAETCEEDRNILAKNLVIWSLSRGATEETKQRLVEVCGRVSGDLALRLRRVLHDYVPPSSPAYQCHRPEC